jgi:hypothetical protein
MALHPIQVPRAWQDVNVETVEALRGLPWDVFMAQLLSSAPVDLLHKLEHLPEVKERLSSEKLPVMDFALLSSKERDRLNHIIAARKVLGKRPRIKNATDDYIQQGTWTAEGDAQSEEQQMFRRFWSMRAHLSEVHFLDRMVRWRAQTFALRPQDREPIWHLQPKCPAPSGWPARVSQFTKAWLERAEGLFTSAKGLHDEAEYVRVMDATLEEGCELAARLKCVAIAAPGTFSGIFATMRGAHVRVTAENQKHTISITIKRKPNAEADVVVTVLEEGVGLEERRVFLPNMTIKSEQDKFAEYNKRSVTENRVAVYTTAPAGVSTSDGCSISNIPCVVVESDGRARLTAQGLAVLDFLLLWNADAVHAAQQLGRLTGHCLDCGAALTSRESLERGVGPKCFAKNWAGDWDMNGVPYNVEEGENATNVSLIRPAALDETSQAREGSPVGDAGLRVTLLATGEVVELPRPLLEKLDYLKDDPVLPMKGLTSRVLKELGILAANPDVYADNPIQEHFLVQMLEAARQLGLADEEKWLRTYLLSLLRLMDPETVVRCFSVGTLC